MTAATSNNGADAGRKGLAGFFFSSEGWPYLLVPFILIAIVLKYAGGGAEVIFLTAAIGLIPAAAIMGRATEELAARSGPGIGGLLNVTFGNFPELIIALFALNKGLEEVVKASLVGSIIGNVLLVMGVSMFVGGINRDRQRFNSTAASVQSSMLLLAMAALFMPAVYELVHGDGLPVPGGPASIAFDPTVEKISAIACGFLLLSYVGGLIFSLVTHRGLFNPVHDDEAEFAWPVKRSIAVLAGASVVVGVMSEILVGSIEEAAHSLGVSDFFVGAFIIAIVGNAAEHWVAVLVAHKDKMDLSVNIAIGSAAQIALFVAPILVLVSFFLGPHPMPLVFNGFELAGLFIAILTANHITSDGESTWFEGLQLMSLYAVIGVVFYFA